MIDIRDDERDLRLRLADQSPDGFDFEARVAVAEAEANAAQLSESLAQIIGGQHQVMAGFRRLETLMAEKARNDSQHAAALAKLLVEPEEVWRASFEGAVKGAGDAHQRVIEEITKATQRVCQVEARLATDNRQRALEQMKWKRWGLIAAACCFLTVPLAGFTGERVGEKAGRAEGYANARDEVAAASWANTEAGEFARALDRIGVLRNMIDCSGPGYVKTKNSRGKIGCQASVGWSVQ